MNPPPRYRVEASGDEWRVYDSERTDSQLRGMSLVQALASAQMLNEKLRISTDIERTAELIQRCER